ncbi:MAG: BspA family leucine-rich repeat surface protein, partial [Bacteroidales bacterium]|nr:BspA family leucine-rich repeat surface protein [Bacteroidales bacterium]
SDKNGTIYLDPESKGSNTYVSYFTSDYVKARADDMPEHIEKTLEMNNGLKSAQLTTSDHNYYTKRTLGEQLKKYRMAITAHPTFTDRVGASNTMSEIVKIVNRTIGVYERDLAITLELVANNNQLIFTPNNPGPFTMNENISSLRIKNYEVTEDIIGLDNFDVGHIFASGAGGGEAALGGVCKDNIKAGGATGPFYLYGNLDRFAIQYFAHELGHQFGAYHTMNADYYNQFYYRNNYEPGSGSTIMSYAGLMGGNNIQSSSDDYFHAASIEAILRFVTRDNDCAVHVETGNTPPTVSTRSGGFVIPINTPFVLEANASDVDDDVITYCWEQFDQGDSKPTDLQGEDYHANQEFTGDGPLFRSFSPTTDNKRYFPKLSKILDGTSYNKEVLPFKTRELNFVVTVRDNNPNGGGLNNELLTFSSTDKAGPFKVTSTFSAGPYDGFSNVLVEWDVANTNTAPVNCQKVNILYSIDGGNNFEIALVENTDNDGSETVKLPNIATAKARIMVKAADNVFLNVNNANFTVVSTTAATPAAPSGLTGSEVGTGKVELSWTDTDDLEDGFYIERKTGSGAFEKIDSVILNKTSYLDETVTTAGNNSYRVAAYNGNGVSAYSNTWEVNIDETTPNAPTGLSGSLSNTSIVELSWTDNSDVENGFIIQRQKGTGSFKKIGTTIPNVTTFTDRSIKSSGDYKYRVKAYNYVGSSNFSDTISINGINTDVPPGTPLNLTAVKLEDITVRLSWTPNGILEDGFIIERKETGGSYTEIKRTGPKVMAYKDSVGDATEYKYRVSAYNTHGNSDYSNDVSVQGTKPFITKWEIAAGDKIDISLIRPKSYNFKYQWLKDGAVKHSGSFKQDNIKNVKISTTFSEAGTYYLEITGMFPGGGLPKGKLKEVTQWGGVFWSKLGFSNWEGNITATDAPNLTKVTSLEQAFYKSPNVNANLNHWDVSTIENMQRMFAGAKAFNGNISSWDVSNVKYMNEMFSGAESFNSDIGNWNVGKVENMNKMFNGAKVFNTDISRWYVGSVTNMSEMFRYASIFNQNIGIWNVNNVTNMGGMFYGATEFNQEIGDWNVSKVTSMANMFNRAENFNGDISGWKTDSLKNVQGMFDKATSFDQDLGGWNVTHIKNLKNMFRNSGMSSWSYDYTLIGWAEQNVQDSLELNSSSKYCLGEAARQKLKDTYKWTIKDGGLKCPEPTQILTFKFEEQVRTGT